MKRVLINTLLLILVLAGLAILAYPTVSNWLQSKEHAIQIKTYKSEVDGLSPQQIEEEWAKAVEYNNSLIGDPVKDPFQPGTGMALPRNYNSVLNVNDNGIMGYIDIPCIKVALPIYHGTEEETLRKGVGHIDSTALPIGGENINPILSAHTGLPSSELFNNLVNLKIGDTFSVSVLDQTLYYKVNQIQVILPEETKDLVAVAGKDYTTLITCTPYGINDHRLVVRGERCYEITESFILDAENTLIWRIMLAGFSLLSLIAMLLLLSRSRKLRKFIWKKIEGL